MSNNVDSQPLRKPPLRRSSEFESDAQIQEKTKRIDYSTRKFNFTRIWYPSRPAKQSQNAYESSLDMNAPRKIIVQDTGKSDRFLYNENTRQGNFTKLIHPQVPSDPNISQILSRPMHTAPYAQTQSNNWMPQNSQFINSNPFLLNNFANVLQPLANAKPAIFHRCVPNSVPLRNQFTQFHPITIRQDEDTPPRFRPKVKDSEVNRPFTTNYNSSQDSVQSKRSNANETSNWNLVRPQFMQTMHKQLSPQYINNFQTLNKQQPFQINTIFEDTRKCMSNESYQSNRHRIASIEGRRCKSTANLSAIGNLDYKNKYNLRNRNSWARRNNEKQGQIPLSAYIAATNQLQKRSGHLTTSEVTLNVAHTSNNRDIYSPYKLEEDDVSLFGSESPLPFDLDSNLSSSSANDGKFDVNDEIASLDDEVIDETLNKLERELIENDVVKLEDLIKYQVENKEAVKNVYQTKDFMQWARVYFNSQLKKKIDPKILDWASKHSSTSSLSKISNESIEEEPEENQTDILSDSVEFEDCTTDYLHDRLNTALKLPTN